ncbi:hypothetical protein M8818_003986 [Zalaria obscura]|uniref:Uncharacterized protein n=1 Tax=Zalaria obscura TaxID=2024903 RepID=A0ACC3SDN2_9PEZI
MTFHGQGSSPTAHETESAWSTETFNPYSIVVYPAAAHSHEQYVYELDFNLQLHSDLVFHKLDDNDNDNFDKLGIDQQHECNSGCDGFTYLNGAAYGTGQGQCWLKSALPQSFASTSPIGALSTGKIAAVMRAAYHSVGSIIYGGSGQFAINSRATVPTVQYPSCPDANNTVQTDGNGTAYTIHCGFDTSIPSSQTFAVGAGGYRFQYLLGCGNDTLGGGTREDAPTSFNDCFTLCDDTEGCDSFTYVGTANGTGIGSCYLKINSAQTGLAPGSGNTYVGGVRVAGAAHPSLSSTSQSSTSSTTGSLSSYGQSSTTTSLSSYGVSSSTTSTTSSTSTPSSSSSSPSTSPSGLSAYGSTTSTSTTTSSSSTSTTTSSSVLPAYSTPGTSTTASTSSTSSSLTGYSGTTSSSSTTSSLSGSGSFSTVTATSSTTSTTLSGYSGTTPVVTSPSTTTTGSFFNTGGPRSGTVSTSLATSGPSISYSSGVPYGKSPALSKSATARSFANSATVIVTVSPSTCPAPTTVYTTVFTTNTVTACPPDSSAGMICTS